MGVQVENTAFELGEWTVEPDLNRIVRGDEIVRIDPRNMKLLQLLASRPGQVIPQSEIEQIVWGDVVVTPNSVYQSIAQLRRALGDEKASPKYIETIARKGYRLVARVVSRAAATAEVSLVPVPSVNPLPKRFVFSRLHWAVLAVSTIAVGAVGALALTKTGAAPQTASRVERPSQTTGDDAFLYTRNTTTNSPHLQIDILEELSIFANNDGRAEDALAHALEAVEFERKTSGDKSPEFAVRSLTLANAYHWLGQYDAAEDAARHALNILEHGPGLQPKKVYALDTLGPILADRGKIAEAESCIHRAIALADYLYGHESAHAVFSRTNLLYLYDVAGRPEEVESLGRQLLLNQKVLDNYKLYEITIRTMLAKSILDQGRSQSAEVESRILLKRVFGLLREDHPFAGSAFELLGRSLVGQGKYQEAEQPLRSAIAIWARTKGWTWRVGRAASVLGESLVGQGRNAEAEKYLTYASAALEHVPEGQLELHAKQEHAERLQKLRTAMQQASMGPTRVAELPGI